MTIHEEIWRPVVGYENFYSISNFGRVRRDKDAPLTFSGKILKNKVNRKGYEYIKIQGAGKSRTSFIHRLVMETFIGESTKQVNHIDFNKRNNHLSNLEYVTNSENLIHAFKNGRIPNCGINIGSHKLKDDDIRYIRNNYSRFKRGGINSEYLSKKFNVHKTVILDVVHNRTWKHVK